MQNNVTRAAVVAEARTWLGTPFHHQASLKGVGCDCIGLIKGVGLALGILDYDPASPEAQPYLAYSRMPNPQMMRRALSTFFEPVAVADVLPGDFYYMAWIREPQHVALVTDTGIIHSYEGGPGKVVEHGLDETWRRRIVAAYRFKYFTE